MNSPDISGWLTTLDPNKISCVLPTFNRPAFLEATLFALSECAELYSNLEVVVVDDGSTGHYGEMNNIVIDTYLNKIGLNIIHIILKENTGSVSLPRNIGISHITGRLISPTDDDCPPHKEKMALLKGAFGTKSDILLAFGNREVADKNKITGKLENKRAANSAHILNDKKGVGMDNGQFIYRADVYSFVDPMISINACDYNLYRTFADFGDFTYIDEVVCTYIWHESNSSKVPATHRTNPAKLVGKYLPYFKPNPFTDKVVNKYVK